MIRATPSHLNKVLWPEFLELSKLLDAYLDEATRDIITRGCHDLSCNDDVITYSKVDDVVHL